MLASSPLIDAPSPYSADAVFAKGSGRRLDLPDPIARTSWNWGAFAFGGVWLIAHGYPLRGVMLLLLDFIPPLGLIAHVWCARAGNRLAYNACYYRSSAEFTASQRLWRNGGLLAVSLAITTIVGVSEEIKAMTGPTCRVTVREHHRLRVAALTARQIGVLHIVRRRAARIAAPNHRAIAHAVRRETARLTGFASVSVATAEFGACKRASDQLNAAILTVDPRQRLADSQSAIEAAKRCHAADIRREIEALALSQKAIAEHDAHLPGWSEDIASAIDLSNACSRLVPGADVIQAERCLQIASRAATIAADWVQRS